MSDFSAYAGLHKMLKNEGGRNTMNPLPIRDGRLVTEKCESAGRTFKNRWNGSFKSSWTEGYNDQEYISGK